MEQPHSPVSAFRMESAAHVASLARVDRVQTRGRVISVTRATQTFLQHNLDVILGAALVVAGALKGYQMLADPTAGQASGFSRELLIGASAFELAFGCWMLGGMYRRLTRWLALGWFTSLGAVALAQAMVGAASCACLGELHADPWLMFAFDVAAVVALWMCRPVGPSSACFFRLVPFLSLLPAAGLLGLVAVPSHEPLFAEIDLGDIAQGGQKQQAFRLRNDSSVSVEVATIETSCVCANVRLERNKVPVGQFLAGTISMDLRQKTNFSGNLAIEARGSTRRGRLAFVVVIRAHVHPEAQGDTDTR